jgi:hypothetical protein
MSKAGSHGSSCGKRCRFITPVRRICRALNSRTRRKKLVHEQTRYLPLARYHSCPEAAPLTAHMSTRDLRADLSLSIIFEAGCTREAAYASHSLRAQLAINLLGRGAISPSFSVPQWARARAQVHGRQLYRVRSRSRWALM